VAGGFEGVTQEPHQLEVRIDDVKVWTGTVGGPEFARRRGPNVGGTNEQELNKKILDRMKFQVPVKAGQHLVQAYFIQKTEAYVEDLFDPSLRRESYRPVNAPTRISILTITGPQSGTAAVSETPSRQRILLCSPASAQDEVCAKKIVATLARRAYR